MDKTTTLWTTLLALGLGITSALLGLINHMDVTRINKDHENELNNHSGRIHNIEKLLASDEIKIPDEKPMPKVYRYHGEEFRKPVMEVTEQVNAVLPKEIKNQFHILVQDDRTRKPSGIIHDELGNFEVVPSSSFESSDQKIIVRRIPTAVAPIMVPVFGNRPQYIVTPEYRNRNRRR